LSRIITHFEADTFGAPDTLGKSAAHRRRCGGLHWPAPEAGGGLFPCIEARAKLFQFVEAVAACFQQLVYESEVGIASE
jgi:hypothetical protein